MDKPRVGIYGLTSCAGDQLAILNCEDELIKLASLLDIRSWVMAQSNNDEETALDIAFVEGVIGSEKDLETLQQVRSRAELLVAIGTCAVWGGVSAMKNNLSRERMREMVYGDRAEHIDIREALPVKAAVDVEYELPGCPIEKEQFLTLVGSLLHGDLPEFPESTVCSECKMKENECLLVHRHEACCGPLTKAGCGARCPTLNVPCLGCHGPIEEAHYNANFRALRSHQISKDDIMKKMGVFASPAWMPNVLVEAESLEKEQEYAQED
ncbi:MAG TPA: NADH:ubiquinone oxidoreductase [bacterium]|nr:NADH:ubiquinone oxidoreductase [bacterium]